MGAIMKRRPVSLFILALCSLAAWTVQAQVPQRDLTVELRQIEEGGLQTMAEPGDAPAGQLIRVRVGPFDTKAEAENAALRLRALELPTVLVRQ